MVITLNHEATMRVQLQQQGAGRTIHHASHVLRSAGGVTTEQLIAALQELRDHDAIPAREQARADVAFDQAVRWIEARPPTGVSGRFNKSYYFEPKNRRESWRFDIEGLAGYNLRQ